MLFKNLGFSENDLINAAKELKALKGEEKWPAKDLIEAGFKYDVLFKNLGFSENDLKKAAKELKADRWTATNLLTTGFKYDVLLNNQVFPDLFSEVDLKNTAVELINGGTYTVTWLEAREFSQERVEKEVASAAAGSQDSSLEGLLNAGFSRDTLLDVGITAHTLESQMDENRGCLRYRVAYEDDGSLDEYGDPVPEYITQRRGEALYRLENDWLRMSEKLVEDYFGLYGRQPPDTENDLTVYFDEPKEGKLAYVVSTSPATLKVNLNYFVIGETPDGGDAPNFSDRIIAHEMVHVAMNHRNIRATGEWEWFNEGVAELIHGIMDVRGVGKILDDETSREYIVTEAFKTDDDPTVIDVNIHYAARYVATAYLNDKLKKKGMTMKDFFSALQVNYIDNKPDIYNSALKKLTDYDNLAAFKVDFNKNGLGFAESLLVSYEESYESANRMDTGAIGGRVLGGRKEPIRTSKSVVPNALADPYITPVYGPGYKLPDRHGIYRYISNKAHYANRFSIDADVVMLTKKQQAEALRFILEHDRKSVQAANGRLVLDGFFFRNYMLTNCGEKLLIDMEADTINGKSIRNIKTEKFTVSVGTEQAPLSYPYNEELNETVYSLTIETFHETYGNIKVVLNKYVNPQVRNGIHMHTEKKLTHKNSKGFIMHFQDYKQFSIRKLGSKQDIADFDKAKVPSMKKEVTEEFKYQNTGTKNLKFLQQ